jgi:hypothetical protein
MADEVYANMMEISCKAGSGKSICAFPDVCMTPPMTPVTPPGVPIPYPNTGMASDCTDGSSTVKISGQEVMLKNKSYFKRSSGDEAGCAPKKNLITSQIMGKIYFRMWSMDVKIEGENVVRHFDIATHNHASEGPGTPPWVHISKLFFEPGGPCAGMEHLKLVPKKPGCPPKNGSHQTPHHLIPGRCTKGMANFKYDKAPCICTLGKNQHTGSHKACHRRFDPVERFHNEQGMDFEYGTARAAAAESAGGAMDPPRDLNDAEKRCVGAQLDSYYKNDPDGPQFKDDTKLKTQGASGKVNENYDQFVSEMESVGY